MEEGEEKYDEGGRNKLFAGLLFWEILGEIDVKEWSHSFRSSWKYMYIFEIGINVDSFFFERERERERGIWFDGIDV